MKQKLQTSDAINLSLKRKVFIVLLALFFITSISFLDERHRIFNGMYNTTTNDLLDPLSIHLSFELNMAHVLTIIILIFTIYTLIKLVMLNQTTTQVDPLKRLFKQYDLIAFLTYLIAIYVFINGFLFSISPVDGASMNPTITNNDYLIIEHRSPSYERFDFVVVRPENHNQFMIKRLIGLPGEDIMIYDDQVYINGDVLDESAYLPEGVMTRCVGESPCTFTLEEGTYFFLGDNRTNSYDSRHFGSVTKDEIFGLVNYRIRPLSNFGRIE